MEGFRHVTLESGVHAPHARQRDGCLKKVKTYGVHLPNSDIYTHSSETTMRQPLSTIPCLFLTLIISPPLITAHSGGHHDPQQQVLENQDTDWATFHMIEEHHISNLDPGAFFSLHDYDSSTAWTPGEILRTYGLDDASSRDVPESKRQEVVRGVLELFDQNGDGIVSRDEWVVGWGRGARLPDFGVCLFTRRGEGRSTSTDLDSGSLGQGIMVTMSTSMKFTTSKSFMTRVRFAFSYLRYPQIHTDDLKHTSQKLSVKPRRY